MNRPAAPSTPAIAPRPSTLRGALDVLLPPTQRFGDEAADEAGWRPDRPGAYCARCGATAAAEAITIAGCPHCRRRHIAWDALWRLGAYRPPLSEWIVACKFRHGWPWAEWFGGELARIVPPAEPRTLIVPVPLHWRRRLLRGYDQAELIARAFAAATGLPLARLLRRRRATRPQTDLHSHTDRRRNVRGAFALRRVALTGWTIWLIDDVTTTGSTLHVCARLLRRAGASGVRIAVAAVADPRGADFQRL